MPTYQYLCDNCEYTFEVFQSITEERLKKCENCKKETLHRLIGTGSGIIFKGTGFYETDYKRKSSAPAKEKSTESSNKKSGADQPAGKEAAK